MESKSCCTGNGRHMRHERMGRRTLTRQAVGAVDRHAVEAIDRQAEEAIDKRAAP